ncbi:MAG: metallophosphoesterase [Phycisphaerales bacterium]
MPAAWNIDLQSAEAVRGAFAAGARANREAACRRGSIDLIEPPGALIATGDLHDNPVHFQRLVLRAGLGDEAGTKDTTHLLLHEIIHSDRLVNGMDFSYRALARVAALKAAFPERVHAILANHELAQMVGAGIVKDGVKVVEAFNEGVEYAFGDDAPPVDAAIKDFVRSMPLALRCRTPRGDILCAHSLPAPWSMQRFDPTVLDRDLTEADYEPRQGAAHLMVWGRGYDADLIEDLVERWGVTMFILGHEHVENGVLFTPPCAIVLNSDHDRGVYLPIDLAAPPSPQEAAARVVALRDPF